MIIMENIHFPYCCATVFALNAKITWISTILKFKINRGIESLTVDEVFDLHHEADLNINSFLKEAYIQGIFLKVVTKCKKGRISTQFIVTKKRSLALGNFLTLR